MENKSYIIKLFLKVLKARILKIFLFTFTLIFIYSGHILVNINKTNNLGSLNFTTVIFMRNYIFIVVLSYIMVYFFYRSKIKFKIIVYYMITHIFAYCIGLIFASFPNFALTTMPPNTCNSFGFYMLYLLPMIFIPTFVGATSLILKDKEINSRSIILKQLLNIIKKMNVEYKYEK